MKGSSNNWNGLPQDKNLFYSPSGCGLPIGNLTSQVFANFYLNSLDHFVKYRAGIRFYGRYVDDFVIIHRDKEYLKNLIPILSDYLDSNLKLALHPQKYTCSISVREYHFLEQSLNHTGYIYPDEQPGIFSIQYGNKTSSYDNINQMMTIKLLS